MKKHVIEHSEVQHIAMLSRLGLKEAEIATFQKELSEIVDYIEALNTVPTNTTEPTSQVTGIENALQPDKILRSLPQEVALSQAPAKENGFFKVKAVL